MFPATRKAKPPNIDRSVTSGSAAINSRMRWARSSSYAIASRSYATRAATLVRNFRSRRGSRGLPALRPPVPRASASTQQLSSSSAVCSSCTMRPAATIAAASRRRRRPEAQGPRDRRRAWHLRGSDAGRRPPPCARGSRPRTCGAGRGCAGLRDPCRRGGAPPRRRRPRPAGAARTRWTASRPCRSAAGMRRRARRRPRPRRRGSRRCRRPGRTTGLKAAELAQGQHARLRRSGPPPVPRCRPRAPAPARRRGRAGCTAGSAAHRGNGATGRVALSGSVTTAASAARRPGASMRVRFSG